MTLIIDSGFRRGSDVIKALALGADAVMVGRATLYGLISGGQAGVQHAIEHNVGIYCLASPIAVRSEVVGAIGVTGRSKEALKPHIQTVQHTAQVISHILSRGS